jgi:site-specific DNA-methyltransferase (adenine-specific)
MNKSYSSTYNPDVLSTLANLSSDEVFTPPHIVNQMLDMLPQELFSDKTTTFLDPATKSGVFLREITKRLIKGLEKEFPDLQERLDHILHNQVFGIAITELTSLLSRRSLYCSKYANSMYSLSLFKNPNGRIEYKKIKHKWKKNKCVLCGANKNEYGKSDILENHAYQFIHSKENEDIFKMKFDVIISNPPYHISTGGGQAQATPLYDKFVINSILLKPRFLSMIIPARWYSGGFPAVRKFKKTFTEGNHIRVISDYPNSSDLFPGIEIKGGVCYFLWERDYSGDCLFVNNYANKKVTKLERPLFEKEFETIIRYNEAIDILKKVQSKKENSFSELLSPLWPFTINSSFDTLTSNQIEEDDIFCYVMKDKGWIRKKEINKNLDLVNKHKLFLPRSVGSADSKSDRLKPIYGGPNTVCSGTYIVAGPFTSKKYAENIISYINTKFFHFLLSLMKITQDTAKSVYQYIPMQDFSEEWNDTKLFNKYNFSKEEIEYINEMVWPKG